VVEDLMVADLIVHGDGGDRCCGGLTAVQRHTGEAVRIRAEAVLLATGGSGHVYRHTTNPSIATGDGVAMAYRAGALVANMEFVQFHPTALFPTEDPAFLISEAVRGEGGVLRARDGRAFMEGRHPEGSLAPRDVVAREIHRVLREAGDDHVTLDVSGIPEALFLERFPAAFAGCRKRGVDPFADGIPVVPAAHYQCGGVWTDHHGATSLPGLFATGEVACTGLHGANRLASNSLLEAVVYSHRAAEYLRELGTAVGEGDTSALPAPKEGQGEGETDEAGADGAAREALRTLLWEHAGIVRRSDELQSAFDHVSGRLEAVEARYDPEAPGSPEELELRNLHQVGWLILRSALARPESRGLHHLEDRPYRDNEGCLHDTVVARP
jgi:L-aspartate oxidase